MKELYDENEHLTDFGIKATRDAAKTILPFLKKYKTVSLIQLQHLFFREMMYQSTLLKLHLQNENKTKSKKN
jgi:hypothetical protein